MSQSIHRIVQGRKPRYLLSGAAISLLMLVMVAAMSVVYVRRMLRVGDID